MPAAAGPPVAVDLQLVLAADVSGSMGPELRRAQRDGFVAAFRDPVLQSAVASGPIGRIAVTYVEWSERRGQRVVVPWRLIDSAEAMRAFAAELAGAEMSRPGSHTSITAALLFAERLFVRNNYMSWRKVIDLSGNGVNNDGPSPATTISKLHDEHLTVNGLVFPLPPVEIPYAVPYSLPEVDLVAYFEREVIVGPGAFVVEVGDEAGFTDAIRRKLVWEIAAAEISSDFRSAGPEFLAARSQIIPVVGSAGSVR